MKRLTTAGWGWCLELVAAVVDIHTTVVNIWALRYLVQTAIVDLPKSHGGGS